MSPMRPCAFATAATALLLASVGGGCSSSRDGSLPSAETTSIPASTTTTEPPLDVGRQVFVYTPTVGECFDRRQLDERPATGPQQTDIVLVLDCSLPHQNEVFSVIEMPSSSREYPGEPAMRDVARAGCTNGFEAYVGKAYETSELEVGYYLPSSNEWSSGTRRLGCYVYDVAGAKLVGSMQGSAR
jgi:hypothetical protein